MVRRSVVSVLMLIAVAGAAVGATLAFRPAPEPRDIVFVARRMAFHVDGDSSPNPIVHVKPGEHVRFVLRNEAAGFEHDLAIPALGLALAPIAAGESRVASVRIPARPGGFPYVCRPHAQMMRGTLVVADR